MRNDSAAHDVRAQPVGCSFVLRQRDRRAPAPDDDLLHEPRVDLVGPVDVRAIDRDGPRVGLVGSERDARENRVDRDGEVPSTRERGLVARQVTHYGDDRRLDAGQAPSLYRFDGRYVRALGVDACLGRPDDKGRARYAKRGCLDPKGAVTGQTLVVSSERFVVSTQIFAVPSLMESVTTGTKWLATSALFVPSRVSVVATERMSTSTGTSFASTKVRSVTTGISVSSTTPSSAASHA